MTYSSGGLEYQGKGQMGRTCKGFKAIFCVLLSLFVKLSLLGFPVLPQRADSSSY